MKTALEVFQDRILNHFLPTFCNDPSRAWGTGGFKEDWHRISEVDAADFLRGIDSCLLEHKGRGLYRASRGSASEQFFWSGSKKKIPRPVTLWAEPIITVAVLARLHFDLGWPKELLGTQPKGWAFDLATYLSSNSDKEHIACEIKKSSGEIDVLLEILDRFASNDRREPFRKELNAFRKLQALKSRQIPLFWAVGPGGLNCAFRIEYPNDGSVHFQKIEIAELKYSEAISA